MVTGAVGFLVRGPARTSGVATGANLRLPPQVVSIGVRLLVAAGVVVDRPLLDCDCDRRAVVVSVGGLGGGFIFPRGGRRSWELELSPIVVGRRRGRMSDAGISLLR